MLTTPTSFWLTSKAIPGRRHEHQGEEERSVEPEGFFRPAGGAIEPRERARSADHGDPAQDTEQHGRADQRVGRVLAEHVFHERGADGREERE